MNRKNKTLLEVLEEYDRAEWRNVFDIQPITENHRNCKIDDAIKSS